MHKIVLSKVQPVYADFTAYMTYVQSFEKSKKTRSLNRYIVNIIFNIQLLCAYILLSSLVSHFIIQ